MHFSISLSFLPLSNLTYAFSVQDNELLERSCWATGQYIYKNKYVLGWCTLPILSRWATDRYVTIVRLFDSYWYTNLSLTRILMDNILLRALKSFNTIYNSIYIYIYIYICMQIEHFHIHAIFLWKFVSQGIVSNHLKQIISNTNQYALSCQSFPKSKSFFNYSNIYKTDREFENKPKIVALIPIFGISTSMRVFLLVSPYSNTITITY